MIPQGRNCTILLICVLLTPGVTLAQDAARPTAASIRQALSRRAGTWITSNAQYRTDENGEPAEYGTHFRAELGSVSITGCLWGQTAGTVAGVYWHFFTGWDPETETLLVYQSGQAGIVGIGHEKLAPAGEPDVVEQLFSPLPGGQRQPFRVRHRSTWIGSDTLKTESFDKTPDGWAVRRTYIWVRRSDIVAPCQVQSSGR